MTARAGVCATRFVDVPPNAPDDVHSACASVLRAARTLDRGARPPDARRLADLLYGAAYAAGHVYPGGRMARLGADMARDAAARMIADTPLRHACETLAAWLERTPTR